MWRFRAATPAFWEAGGVSAWSTWSAPAVPGSSRLVDTPCGRGWGAVAVSGGYAYVADESCGSSGHRREDALGAGRGGVRGQIGIEGWARRCRGCERLRVRRGAPAGASVVGGSLRVVDVSTPSAPVEVGAIDTPGWSAFGVAVSGGYAYVADVGCGPAGDRRGHAIRADRGGLRRHRGHLGVGCRGLRADTPMSRRGSTGLGVIDVSTPSAPADVGVVDTPVDLPWLLRSRRATPMSRTRPRACG